MKKRWAVLALLALAAGCVADQARVSREAVTVDARGVTVAVNAAAPWVDTGIDLQAGENWRLDAAGRWSIGAFCGETGPDGVGVSPLCAGDSLGIGATGSTLIGRIGVNGRAFKIGNGLDLRADAPGRLFLAAYDMIPFDNVGTVNVTVRPTGAKGQAVASSTTPAAPATPTAPTGVKAAAPTGVKAAAPSGKPMLSDGSPVVIPSFAEMTDHTNYSVKELQTYPHFRLHAKMKLEARARRAEGVRLMAEGEAARQAGDKRQALKSFAAAYAWLEADPVKGREKEALSAMARVLGELRISPVVPAAVFAEIEAAGRRWRGGDAPTSAEAARRIELALRQAPWWSGAHLELGMAREAAGQNLRARAAYENFLVLKPNGPAADALRARWADIDVRAREENQVGRWNGFWVATDTWTQAGAVLEAQLDGAVVNFVVIAHTDAGKANGWKPGDVMFTGTIEGDKVTGWAVARGECKNNSRPDMCRACFGDEMWFETVLTMRPDGNTLDGLSQWYWPPRPKAGGTQCVFAKSTHSTSTHEIGRIVVLPEHM